MPASQASTETRVPRQVQARLNASLDRYKPAESDPLNPEAAAADPASPPAAPAATPAEPAADPRHTDPAYWRARFEVTSGLLSKERENRRVERDALHQQVADLQSKARSTPTAALASAEIDLSKFFTPAQIESYGEEQCRAMAQGAQAAVDLKTQALVDAAVRPLVEQRERDATDATADKQQKFDDALLAAWPNWKVEDADAKWRTWLEEEDENGAVRQTILNIHLGNGDVPKIMRMRKVFLKMQPVRPPPPVAPSGSGAQPAIDADPPTRDDVTALTYPSPAEIKTFYSRSTMGKVKDDERVAFEARLKLGKPGR